MDISDRMLDTLAYEVRKSRGWIKFLGIVFIVTGAIQALSIVGIVIAWLPIWMGVLLMQVAKFADRFEQLKDVEALHQMLIKLRVFFTVQGIMLIIALILAVVMVIVYIIFGIALVGMMSQGMSY